MNILYVSFVTATFLGGCVTASEVETLIPQNITPVTTKSELHGAVSVREVSPDQKSAFSSIVSDKSLNDALRAALEQNGMLSNMDGSYSVQASLTHLDMPAVGLNMTVTSKVQYLVKDETGRVLLDRTLSAPYTAEMSKAFVGATRVRLATEGAVRENISSFIALLSDWATVG